MAIIDRKNNGLVLRWLAALLLLSILIFIHINLYPNAEDDAYIHFRIAENLAQFGQPYYNLNEPVFATSSVVWTLLLSGLSFFPVPLPITVSFINALFVGMGGLLYARIIRKTTQNRILPWVIPVMYAGIMLRSSVGLMETPLAMLVLGLGIYLFIIKKPVAFYLLAVAVFVRYELAVFLLVFLAAAYFRKELEWKSAVLYAVLGALPFLIFDLVFFRTVIPNTVIAKSSVYQLSAQAVITSIFGTLPKPVLLQVVSPYWQVVFFALTLVLSLYAIRLLFRQGRPIANKYVYNFLILLSGVMILVLYLARSVFMFTWYLPLYWVPILVGLCGIYSYGKPFKGISVVIVLALPFILTLAQTTVAAAGRPFLYDGYAIAARVRNYLEIGQKLYRAYPEASLMSSEIGGLGYSFKGHIDDALGLASPDALEFHPMNIPEERSTGGIGAIPVGFIEQEHPDIIVSYDIFIEAFLKSDLCDDYIRVTKPPFLPEDMMIYSPDAFPFSENLNIFFRKDLLPAPNLLINNP